MGVRPAAVAGTFYPANPAALAAEVDRHLAGGRATLAVQPELERPKAIIAPHAGYIFSGPIAGTVFAAVEPYAAEIERVVLLGPAHRVYIDGLAGSDADAFATPLHVSVSGPTPAAAPASPR